MEGNQAVTLYETLFIVHPEKGTRTKEFIERFTKILEGQQGEMASVEEWGLRDLAYRIEKQSKGVYALLKYRATGAAVNELERNLKLTDGVMRYLTVCAEEEAAAEPPAQSQAEESRSEKVPASE